MNQNPFTSIMIFTAAMLFGVVMTAIVIVFVRLNAGAVINTQYNEPVILMGIVTGIASMPAGILVYKRSIAKTKDETVEEIKLMGARRAIILRSAIWEAAIMINLIAFYLHTSSVSLVVAGMGILLFLAFIPTPTRIKNDLEIE